MKVHKVTILIVDSDDLGKVAVRETLESTHYPNHCIAPQVMAIESVEVEWCDEHPLNRSDTVHAEYKRLFGGGR